MTREILVSRRSAACAVMEDGRLCEYVPGESGEAATGAVFLGRVTRVVKATDAAFVDIGAERNGFLPLRERSETFAGQPLREGDRVTVQVVREAHGEKGAFLTRDVNLTGENLILMPCNRFVGASGKLPAQEAEEAIRCAAGVLRQSFRSVDLICRLRDDAFVVIMSRVSSALKPLVLEKLTRVNEKLRPLSISAGVAFSDRENPGSDILADAEAALEQLRAEDGLCRFF